MTAISTAAISTSAISTTGLTKKYGQATVVDSLDLSVRVGDRYGFLGPNGSGKTTTVRMLLGLVFASAGSIEVLGRPMPRQVKRVLPEVGALVEGPAFYDHLSARHNLSLLDAAGKGGSRPTRRARIGDALDRVGLGGVGGKAVGAYSLGMRGRLGLAGALLRAPKLLVLDEPTNGLDPQGIAEIRLLLTELNEQAGTTIFLSSHLLAEVEQLCTRVGVLDRGKLVVQDQLDDLCGPTGRVIVVSPDAGTIPRLLGAAVAERAGDRVVLRGVAPTEVASRLVEGGVRIAELTPERRTLEDVVLANTGHGSDRVAGSTSATPERDAPSPTTKSAPPKLREVSTPPGTGPLPEQAPEEPAS